MGFKCPVCNKDFKKNKKEWEEHIKNEHEGKGFEFVSELMSITDKGGFRPGAGRNPIPKERKKISKTITISPEAYEKIKKFKNKSKIIEKCIHFYFENISSEPIALTSKKNKKE